ncbi:MAG: heparan-alpha-glucosaminide N-acetyltransferase domain-containing protein [Myxococcota bacterium]
MAQDLTASATRIGPSPVRDLGRGTARDASIDALRGFAVFSMFGANLTPYTVTAPHPLWFRIWASLAAPIFVFLAGYMVGAHAASRPLVSFVKRGAALLIIAALVDWLCWGVTPFTTFDVLYVIALGLPASAWLVRLPSGWQLFVAALPIVVAPLLQNYVGYGREASSRMGDAVQAFLVDGWFPMCPWLGISLCGAVVGRARESCARAARPKLLWVGAIALLLGAAVHALTTPSSATRGGYAELFYPPSLSYVLLGVGLILLLLAMLPSSSAGLTSSVLGVYGRTALLMYLTHTLIIALIFKRFLRPQGFSLFFAVYSAFAGLLWAIACWVRERFPKPRRFWARLLLGS